MGAEATVALPPGTKLGKYELLSMLAVGGMAEIHLARALGLEGFEKLVVLKRILPQLAADEDFVRMFLDEARLAATLHHPNVVEVFDIGVAGGSYFFTMEYVRGEDLGTVIATAARQGEGISLENAIAVVIGVAAGLHHAHEMRGPDGEPLGIVHRDVSPSNVLITYDGGVKVCDFGIAKAFARQSRLTQGVIKGKISYMSPEQCRGDTLDRRSDIFSIGILLYELTTGKRLFRGGDLELLRKIAEEDVAPPSLRVPDYPPGLEKIVLKALARDRERRFASAQELQLALEELAREERLLVSSALLGRWMHQIFPERVKLQTPAPRPALIATGTPLPEGAPAGFVAARAAAEVGVTTDPALTALPLPAPAKKASWPWLAAGAAVLAAGVGGFALAGGGGGGGGGGGESTQPPAQVEPAPAREAALPPAPPEPPVAVVAPPDAGPAVATPAVDVAPDAGPAARRPGRRPAGTRPPAVETPPRDPNEPPPLQ